MHKKIVRLRIISAIIISSLLALIGQSCTAAGEVKLYVRLNPSSVLVGQTTNVEVRLSKTTSDKVDYAKTRLVYPASQLEVTVTSRNGSALTSGGGPTIAVNNSAGTVDITASGNPVATPSDTLVATLTFRAKAVGKPMISFASGAIAGDYHSDNNIKNYLTGTAGGMLTITAPPVVVPTQPAPAAPAPAPAPAPTPTIQPSSNSTPTEPVNSDAPASTGTTAPLTPTTPETPQSSADQNTLSVSAPDGIAASTDKKATNTQWQNTAVWTVAGVLVLGVASAAVFAAYKQGLFDVFMTKLLMHSGRRTKYRMYELGSIAAYCAAYLTLDDEASWNPVPAGSAATEPDSVETEAASTDEDLPEPEPQLRAVTETPLELPPVPVELKPLPARIPNDLIIKKPGGARRSVNLVIPKRHRRFSTFTGR